MWIVFEEAGKAKMNKSEWLVLVGRPCANRCAVSLLWTLE